MLELKNTQTYLDAQYAGFMQAAEAVVSRANPVWTDPPASWIDGAHLGNGDLGAMVYGPIESLTFALSKSDLWNLDYNKDESGLTFDKLKNIIATGDRNAHEKLQAYYLKLNSRNAPCSQPAGLLRLNLCEGATTGYYNQKVDMYNGQCLHSFSPLGDNITTGENAIPESQYRIISFIHALNNVLVIRLLPKTKFRDDAGPFRITLSRPLNPKLAGPKFAVYGQIGCMEFNLPKSCRYTVACKVLESQVKWSMAGGLLSGLCQQVPSGPITILCSVATTNDTDDTRAAAKLLIDSLGKQAFTAISKSHVQWWHKLWNRSHIELADKQVEKYYHHGVYTLAAMSQPGKQLTGLQGVWLNQNAPPWNGDYHGDINIQCPFWQCFSGNRLELAEPYYRHYLHTLDRQKANTLKFYGLPGVKFAMAGDPLGRDVYGYMTTTAWPCCSAWVCEHYINHWKFTRDKKFLKEVAWPVLYESSRFLLAYLVPEKDGLLHVKPTNMPELWLDWIDAWGSDSPMDLALIHELFAATIEAAAALNIEQDFAEKLAHALGRLAPYPVDKKTGIKTLREKQYDQPYLYTIFMLYPANIPDVLENSRFNKIIRKTFKRVATGDFSIASCWACVIAAQAARLGDSKTAWRVFRTWGTTGRISSTSMTITEDWVNKSNSLMNWKGKSIMQIDGTAAYPAAVNETLLQSQGGRIKLFPAVPARFTGAFHSLRTANGFLVSAKIIDGRITDAVVKSIFGGVCEIEHKQLSRRCKVRQLAPQRRMIKAEFIRSNVISFNSKAGSIYKLALQH